MPPTLSLPQFSGRQIEATSGFRPRLAYADILRDELPNFYAARQAGQQNRALDLSEQQMEQQNRLLDIQARSLTSQEEAQASAQTQQTIGSGIQAVGTLGQGALAAKQLGLFGGKTATGLSAAATPAPSLAVGASTGTAVLPNTAAAGGVALDTGGAVTAAAATGTQAVTPTGFASLGTLGGAAGGLAAAGGGALAGSLVGPPIRKLAGGGVKGRLAGAAGGATAGGLVGAGIGTFVFPGIGTLAGGIIGGAVGGLTGGLCVLHEAGYGVESIEVAIVRRFRDAYLDKPMLRAYYSQYQDAAERMHKDPAYRREIRTKLTDPLVRYAAYTMQIPYASLLRGDEATATAFLHQLRVIGKDLPPFRRKTGEIV